MVDITDPVMFAHWWHSRDNLITDDRQLQDAAEAAGLIVGAGGVIALTGKGKRLRALGHETARRRREAHGRPGLPDEPS